MCGCAPEQEEMQRYLQEVAELDLSKANVVARLEEAEKEAERASRCLLASS